MRDRRHFILKAIFILYIIGLCFCCFWNFRGSIDLGTEWWGIPKDKIVHFFLFFPFPIVFYLAFSARYITYEQVLRFLMDYIDGDKYYKTAYPGHNLVRTHAQYKLLQSIESQYDAMKKIVDKYAR